MPFSPTIMLLLQSFKALNRPNLRWLVIAPLMISTIIVIVLSGFLGTWIADLINEITLFHWLFSIIIGIALFFFGFSFINSIVCAPFNELIAQRILATSTVQLPTFFSWKFIRRELIKIIFLGFMGIISTVLMFTGFLAPIGYLLAALAFGYQFLDFSLYHLQIPLSKVPKLYLKHPITAHGSSLLFFTIFLSVPILGLLVPTWATIFFATWLEMNNDLKT